MYVSPRFRDIFSSGPIRTRRTDTTIEKQGETPTSAAPAPVTDAEAIWLDITAAHRRAARVFTPTALRAEELATDEA